MEKRSISDIGPRFLEPKGYRLRADAMQPLFDTLRR